jgi:two-component system chemotaxis response regulator CheB
VVQHRSVRGDCLAEIISAGIDLPVVVPGRRGHLRAGAVHVVPAHEHGSIDDEGQLCLVGADRCRADPLLTSAASYYRERLIAVVLTGRLNDGAAGVREVKRHGGRVVVQDRQSSYAFGMPSASIATGCVDFTLPLDLISGALVALSMMPGAAELFAVGLPSRSALAA